MSLKSEFTEEEWSSIVESPMLASVAITAADPNGLWGTLKEGFASAKGLTEARDQSSELVMELVAELTTDEGRVLAKDGLRGRMSGAEPDQLVSRTLDDLRNVASMVALKMPSEAEAYRQWIYSMAARVAEASKEGGFLGIGGVRVSEKEHVTLRQIADALDLKNTP